MTEAISAVIDSRCGLHCTECEYRLSCGCGGCIESAGHPFHGECPVAVCCQAKGYLHCGECGELPCAQIKAYSCDDAEHGDTPPGARIEQCRRWITDASAAMTLHESVIARRMERQYLTKRCSAAEYDALFRDLQPGLNYYWHGFGFPPELTHRTDFDDREYNKTRQADRTLVKLRLDRGNLGWILRDDLPLFYALYRKPLDKPTRIQTALYDLIVREGPLTIQQMKEETGYLVKQITPALHRLQQAFMIYEDQYDGEWDRGWYRFEEMFPEVDLNRYTRLEALKIVLPRFARRMVYIDTAMAKAFYKLPEKELKAAVLEMVQDGVLVSFEAGYLLKEDAKLLVSYVPKPMHFVYAIHRNDILYKAQEHLLKAFISPMCENLPYDHEPLQYLLIDGEFHGAVVGHFRNGPYDLNDVVCDLPDAQMRKEEILEAIRVVNFGHSPLRFLGKEITQ